MQTKYFDIEEHADHARRCANLTDFFAAISEEYEALERGKICGPCMYKRLIASMDYIVEQYPYGIDQAKALMRDTKQNCCENHTKVPGQE